jgi:hypothetical protein
MQVGIRIANDAATNKRLAAQAMRLDPEKVWLIGEDDGCKNELVATGHTVEVLPAEAVFPDGVSEILG